MIPIFDGDPAAVGECRPSRDAAEILWRMKLFHARRMAKPEKSIANPIDDVRARALARACWRNQQGGAI